MKSEFIMKLTSNLKRYVQRTVVQSGSIHVDLFINLTILTRISDVVIILHPYLRSGGNFILRYIGLNCK